MKTRSVNPPEAYGVSRRELLQAGMAAGATLAAWPLYGPPALWGGEIGTPKRGGTLRVRGWDPPHFDPHLTINNYTNYLLSLPTVDWCGIKSAPTCSQVRSSSSPISLNAGKPWMTSPMSSTSAKIVAPQASPQRPRTGGRGREIHLRPLHDEKGNANRYMLEPLDRVKVVDRYTVKFLLKEPFVWLVNTLAYPWTMWIVAPELVQHHGDLKKAENTIGTGPFVLERYDPNVKAVFKRHPEYFRQGQPYIDGVDWLVIPDESTGLAMYRTGQLDLGPQINWAVRQQDLEAMKKTSPPDLSRFPGCCARRGVHARGYGSFQRRARAARHLPCHRPPGAHRGGVGPGRTHRRCCTRPGRVVAPHRAAR